VRDYTETAVTLHPLFTQGDIRGLVFDLDGTVIDSAADIIQAMRLTFEEGGVGVLPPDYFPDDLHGTRDGIMRYILADMGWPIPEHFEELKVLYVDKYSGLDHQTTRLYDDAKRVLETCKDASFAMGVCTNKVHASAVSVTHKVGIHDLFHQITGSDSWSHAKPSPVPLLETIRMMGLEPTQCLYFGDTSVDAECARAAGVPFVLHTSGYGDRALKDSPRNFMFQHWRELLVA